MFFPQEAPADTTQSSTTGFDSLWATPDGPVQAANALDRFMLAQDKLYTVLLVVLAIWFGVVYFIFRTDRKLSKLERSLDESIADSE